MKIKAVLNKVNRLNGLFLSLVVVNLLVYFFVPFFAAPPIEPYQINKDVKLIEVLEVALHAENNLDHHQQVASHDNDKVAVHMEHSSAHEEPVSAHEEPTVDHAAVKESLTLCYELGPLGNNDITIRLTGLLESKGLIAHPAVQTVKKAIGYWVFIPPLRSRALGRLKVEEIKLKGFTDVFLLTKNQPKYAIALGLFKEKEFAHRRMLKTQSLGFNAKMDIRYKNHDTHWLKVEVEQLKDLNQQAWLDILQKFENIELKTVNCR